jgi:hypothetical protein
MEYTGPLDTIERPNHDILIIGIEVEEVQAKGIRNIFNKIIAEKSPNIKKEMIIQLQETFRKPRDKHKGTLPHHITIKTWSIQNKERKLKAAKEMHKSIRIRTYYST